MDAPDNRGHITKLHNVVSLVAFINAIIIQGSVVGPPSYVVYHPGVSRSSLIHTWYPPKPCIRSSHSDNHLLKYADDTYLLVGSSNIATLTAEFERVKTWAFNNNLRLQEAAERPHALASH